MKPPLHVLTRPEVYGLIPLDSDNKTSRTGCVVFGEYVKTLDGEFRIFAGCAASGKPYLIPTEDQDRLPTILARLHKAREHHESEAVAGAGPGDVFPPRSFRLEPGLTIAQIIEHLGKHQ